MNRAIALLRAAHKRLLRAFFGLDDDAEPLVNRPLAHRPWVNRPWASPQWGRHQPHPPRAPRVLKRWQNTIAGAMERFGGAGRE